MHHVTGPLVLLKATIYNLGQISKTAGNKALKMRAYNILY